MVVWKWLGGNGCLIIIPLEGSVLEACDFVAPAGVIDLVSHFLIGPDPDSVPLIGGADTECF